MTGKMEVDEKKTKPHNMSDCSTSKRLCFYDKKENEDKTGRTITLIRQYAQVEETAAQDINTIRKNEQKNSTTVN